MYVFAESDGDNVKAGELRCLRPVVSALPRFDDRCPARIIAAPKLSDLMYNADDWFP